jgi:hypothetical protein
VLPALCHEVVRTEPSHALSPEAHRRMAQHARISWFPAPRESVRDSGIASRLGHSAPVARMWPSAKGQTQTSIQAGGIANALMRFSTSGFESLAPLARL